MSKFKNKVYVLIEGNIPFDSIEEISKEEYAKRFEKGHIASTVLIQTEDRFILVDPGLEDVFDRMEKSLENVKIKTGSWGRSKSLTFSDIDLIINTHLHKDHSENNFFLAHDYAIPVIENDKFFNGKLKVELKEYEKIWLLKTPGHTKYHASILVDSANVYYPKKNGKFKKEGSFKNIVIAGDAIVTAEQMYQNIPYPFAEDLTLAHISMGKLMRIADYIIPGHGHGFELKKHKIKKRKPTDAEFIKIIKQKANMHRQRSLDDYHNFIKNRGLEPPELQQSMRVLDMGCGVGNAMFGIIEAVGGGYCSNEMCIRHHFQPYLPDSLESLVDRKCKQELTEGRICNHDIDTGRVIGVDYSEEVLKIAERTLRKRLKNEFGDKFLVIRASTDKILSETGISSLENEQIVRDRIKSIDIEANRKTILLYQEKAIETLNLPSNYFDVIYCIYMLTYEKNPIEVILDMLHMLKVGGSLYIIGAEPFIISKKKLTEEQTEELELKLYTQYFTLQDALDKMKIKDLCFVTDFLKKYVSGIEIENGNHSIDVVVKKTRDIKFREIEEKFEHYYHVMPHLPRPRKMINAFYVKK